MTAAQFDALPDDTARALVRWMAQADIAALREAFERTGAGLHPCRAWRAARATGQPAPDWVLTWMDRAAEAADSATTTAEAAEAFGMLHPDGGASMAPAAADAQLEDHQRMLSVLRAEVARIGNGHESAPRNRAEVLRRMAQEFRTTPGALRQKLRRLGEHI